MIKIKYLTILLCLLGCAYSSSAQSYTHQQETLPCVKKKFSIVAHIFADSLGDYGIDEASIKNATDGMNFFFRPIMVSFEVCEFRYHPNFEHDTLNTPDEMTDIMQKYHADYRINFYFVTQLSPEATEAGIANGSIGDPDGSGIFIAKGMGVNSGVFAHEMGHFCSLQHTFAGSGSELVNGTNCTTEGDGFCDTPADPFVAGDPMTEYVKDCRFISEKTDANGEYYNPDLGNVMSYYQCNTCGFSWEQLNRMAQVILATAMAIW